MFLALHPSLARMPPVCWGPRVLAHPFRTPDGCSPCLHHWLTSSSSPSCYSQAPPPALWPSPCLSPPGHHHINLLLVNQVSQGELGTSIPLSAACSAHVGPGRGQVSLCMLCMAAHVLKLAGLCQLPCSRPPAAACTLRKPMYSPSKPMPRQRCSLALAWLCAQGGGVCSGQAPSTHLPACPRP